MASVLPPRHVEGTYSFASQPKVVTQRKIYRENLDEDETTINSVCGNLMYDRRVIRGNTYALNVLPANAQPDPLEFHRNLDRRRRAYARKNLRDQLRQKSPVLVEGRLNQPVQTELYLEALSDMIDESDVQCQTDDFLDRPPTPLYIPPKFGLDVETQIYDGDLFCFDLEVEPILQVLIGKTMEQALLEVVEEEELARIRIQQLAFEELRMADLVEVQRLAEQDRRIREEKEKRRHEFLEIEVRQKELAEKVTAQAFAKAYLSNLEPSVFMNLAENGYFYDPVERDIEEYFLPWLMDQIEEEVDLENRARIVLDGLIREVVQERHHEYRQLELLAAEKALMKAAGTALKGEDKSGDELEPSELDQIPSENMMKDSLDVEQPDVSEPMEDLEPRVKEPQSEEPKVEEDIEDTNEDE